MTNLLEFDTEFEMSEEDEKGYWSGPGYIIFFVQQNIDNVFEIEIDEYTGCAGGADETIGLEWLIHHELIIDRDQLKEGHTYTIEGLNVVWTRGDGWMTDDDVDYYYAALHDKIEPWRWFKQKVTNLWWQNIGWRLRK